jgi:hypothetical protein
MSALDRLKLIQYNFRRNWDGIQCESSGRPGTSNFVNRKRSVTLVESVLQEDERQKQLWKIFTKLKEMEDERANQQTGTGQRQPSAGFG